MDHIGIRTFWFLVLPVLFKQTNASKHNYVLEGDIDDNMKIVKEIPGIFLYLSIHLIVFIFSLI